MGPFRGGGVNQILRREFYEHPDFSQELSGDPNPQYFLKSIAVQIRGVLQYKWEVYCWVSLSSKFRSKQGTTIQMERVLPYKLEVYCSTFPETKVGVPRGPRHTRNSTRSEFPICSDFATENVVNHYILY